MHNPPIVLLALGLLVSTASAQRLASYDPFGSLITEVQPPTALLPAPNPPIITYPTAPLLPPPPFAAIPVPADSTFDNVIGMHWFCDGFVLAAMPTPSFPPLGPAPPPIPIPPPVMGMIGGPVTAIALDPVAGIMYLSSIPGLVVGVAPVPGLPMVVPPFPIPFPAPPIAGLEWDGATGSLWAVDVLGVAYNFLPGGAPLAPPVFPFFPLPGPAGDIAIDKIGTVNAFGVRPLYVSGVGIIVDITDPAAIPFPSGPPSEGLAFMDTPAEVPPLPGCEGCPLVSAGPTAFTTSVMSTGNAAFAVGMGGMTPFAGFGIFGFDVVAGPFIPLNGPAACPLGLGLTPTLILVLGGPADAAGDIFLPLPLGVPVGTFLHNQNFTFCATLPSGFAFSRLQTITAGGF